MTEPRVNPYAPPVPLGLDPVRAGQVLLVTFNGDTRYYEVLACTLEEKSQRGTPRGPVPAAVNPACVTLDLALCLWLDPATRGPGAPDPPPMGAVLLDLSNWSRGATVLTVGRLVYLLSTISVVDVVESHGPTGARRDGPTNITVTLERAWWLDRPVDAGSLSEGASTP